ncbi:MAG TPA: hypothetical protein VIK30_08615 [Polyangia bacterium]
MFLAVVSSPRAASAQDAGAKTFIDYLQPTPLVCPLNSNTWGCTASQVAAKQNSCGNENAGQTSGPVVPRDTCNGIESPMNPPKNYYWDGKIIRAPDGIYHLFADRWPGTSGFGAWTSSDPIHAVGDGGPLGPFTDMGYAYTYWSSGDAHHGHNSMACVLLDGVDAGVPGAKYCLIASEVVPFTIWTSPSLDGPWTGCPNGPSPGQSGENNGPLIQTNGLPGSPDGHPDSNVSIVPRPDGEFEIVQRHGLIALSKTGICGPYLLQQPTNTYPPNEQPSYSDGIYPNRQRHADPLTGTPGGPPVNPESYSLIEDPVIWYSGGKYHVLYDYPDDRVGYHLTSADGIHNWTDEGLAYDPRMAQKIFGYTGGTTAVGWYKMERTNVLIENGHVTHVTWAVSDVDKNNQIGAGSDHGSKVIVVPFDGCAFDHETGNGPPCNAGLEGGAPGDAAADATIGDDAGVSSSGGSSGGVSSSGGGSSSGSTGGAGATSGGGGDAGSAPGTAGSGCGCVVGAGVQDAAPPAGGLLVALGAWIRIRARRSRAKRGVASEGRHVALASDVPRALEGLEQTDRNSSRGHRIFTPRL